MSHRANVPEDLIGIDAGESEHSTAFQQLYHLTVRNCVGCCWDYLVNERQYQSIYDSFNHVKFSHNPQATVAMYVDGLQRPNHKNGVIKTGHDINLGHPGPRTVKQGHSYQIYVPPNQQGPNTLALGKKATVRIEAIAVPELKGSYELDGCYFNYCDAALLELYREEKQQRSLKGICCSMQPPLPDDDDLAGELNNLSIGNNYKEC